MSVFRSKFQKFIFSIFTKNFHKKKYKKKFNTQNYKKKFIKKNYKKKFNTQKFFFKKKIYKQKKIK